jgi:hypothetical protein
MQAIQRALGAGQRRVGEPLPTVRQLAAEMHIAPQAVSRVYARLERAGLIHTEHGATTLRRAWGASCGAASGGRGRYCKQCGAPLSPSANAGETSDHLCLRTRTLWAITATSLGGLAIIFHGIASLLSLSPSPALPVAALISGLLMVGFVVALLIRTMPWPSNLHQPERRCPDSAQPAGSLLEMPQTNHLSDGPLSVTEATTRSFDAPSTPTQNVGFKNQ